MAAFDKLGGAEYLHTVDAVLTVLLTLISKPKTCVRVVRSSPVVGMGRALCHEQRHVAHPARPSPLQHNTVQIQMRMFPGNRPVTPRLDGRVNLLVEGQRPSTATRACPTTLP